MEAGGVVMVKQDWCTRRRFWYITLLLSLAVMAISLLVFCLSEKPNNMESKTAYAIILTAKCSIIHHAGIEAVIGAHEMWGVNNPRPPEEFSPADRAGHEQAFVMFICLVTLGSGKIVEVYFFTMSFIIGLIALAQLFFYPTADHDDFDMNHFWFTVGLGTLTGLVCLVPNIFFFLGWFSIFILSYVFIVRYNFPTRLLSKCSPWYQRF